MTDPLFWHRSEFGFSLPCPTLWVAFSRRTDDVFVFRLHCGKARSAEGEGN
jgi:hypothetical protein